MEDQSLRHFKFIPILDPSAKILQSEENKNKMLYIEGLSYVIWATL